MSWYLRSFRLLVYCCSIESVFKLYVFVRLIFFKLYFFSPRKLNWKKLWKSRRLVIYRMARKQWVNSFFVNCIGLQMRPKWHCYNFFQLKLSAIVQSIWRKSFTRPYMMAMKSTTEHSPGS